MAAVDHAQMLELLRSALDGEYNDGLERFVTATVTGYVVLVRLTPPDGSDDVSQEFLIAAS